MADGIPIEFIGRDRLNGKDFGEQVDLVLSEVKDGKIVILDNSMDPEGRRKLIETSMEEIDEEFPGIEFTSLETGDFIDRAVNKIYNLIGKERRRGLTIVGNSEVMEKVKEDKKSVSLVAKAAEGG